MIDAAVSMVRRPRGGLPIAPRTQDLRPIVFRHDSDSDRNPSQPRIRADPLDETPVALQRDPPTPRFPSVLFNDLLTRRKLDWQWDTEPRELKHDQEPSAVKCCAAQAPRAV
jgi:hypothetical protein